MASALSRSVLSGRLEAGGSTKTAVERTSDDAAISKLSAATLGYYTDEFMPFFVKGGTRRSPLINRGYFARVSAVRELVTEFCTKVHGLGSQAQIVSLGAGIDTTFWFMEKNGIKVHKYVEIDLPAVVHNKLGIIRRTPLLSGPVAEPKSAAPADAAAAAGERKTVGSDKPQPETGDGSRPYRPPKLGEVVLNAEQYALATADLRDSKQVRAVLEEAGVDFSKPTLFLSECVLVYMPTEEADAIIQWCAESFERAAFVCYEQVRVGDAFGAVMLAHLEKRGSPLRTCVSYPGIPDLARRYLRLGFDVATVYDMDDVYYRWLPGRERCARAWRGAERKELFDELEEWHMIQRHYSISVAAKDPALVEAIGGGDKAAGGEGVGPELPLRAKPDDDDAPKAGAAGATSGASARAADPALSDDDAAKGAWPAGMDVRRQWAGLSPEAQASLAESSHWGADLLFAAQVELKPKSMAGGLGAAGLRPAGLPASDADAKAAARDGPASGAGSTS